MLADRDQQNLIATFRYLDDAGDPITSLAWNTAGISIGYKRYGATSWTNLNLASATVGTYTSNGFVEDPDGNGFYELGVPNASRISGHRTVWRFKHGANQYRYDSIDYVAIPAQESSGINLEFAIPGVSEVFTTSNSLYVQEREVEVTFTANQDVSAIPLVLIFEDADGIDKFIINDSDMTKTGDSVVITLPDTFTDAEKTLQWAIRNQDTDRVYGSGSISVVYAPYQG